MSEKALNGLLSRAFKLGGDATITAGPVGAGAASTVNADMVSFARSKGVYAGVSLDGVVISPDEGANKAFYGRAVSPVDILVRGRATSPAAASLQQTLARITR
jgi:lipid-binding SYLF domain-containing protein